MAEYDDLEKMMRKLTVAHAETRWLTLRLDDDVQEILVDLREIRGVQEAHTERLDSIDTRLDSIDNRLDSMDGRLDSMDGRLDDHSAVLQGHTLLLQEHTGRFDSIDSQLRSLTQLVGQVISRLPQNPEEN